MKHSKAGLGRSYVIRLEHGDIIHERIEQFCVNHHIAAGVLTFIGGVDRGSRLIVGPEKGEALPVKPMEVVLEETHEAHGNGTVFPDENKIPILHMHISCGRRTSTITGCVRRGVIVWHVGEVILTEITDTGAVRKKDKTTGFELLSP